MTKSRTRPRQMSVAVYKHGEATPPILKINGTAIETSTETRFVGLTDSGEMWHASFPPSILRGPGRPSNTAAKNMTTVLRNMLAQNRYALENPRVATGREIVEDFAERSVRALQRANKARVEGGGRIRLSHLFKLEDGRLMIICWMHDDQDRDGHPSGPAWVMTQGDDHARFVANAVAP